jgi:eukaryotic-like serine/threonine-protein kinase
MELVNGLPLTKFCDGAKLMPRERLELFVPICRAVQHALQKGIVHRDLKPSNVLVTLYDGKPVPTIIDFGVAKATGGKVDESLSTQFGAVVGTFEYMTPEQAGFSAIDVDTRADVYSLGVILYELLTGLRPIDGKRSTDEALASLAALRQTEPKKLMAMLRGELDWVVLKCLEKDRSRRYETVNGLARDIQRYLADEPVEARPPSAGYRLKKFVWRNKGPVVAVAFVILALIVGIIGTTWGLVVADTARQAESDQRVIAETREKDALAEKAKALAAAEEERQAKQREVEQRAIAETRRADAEAQRKRGDEQKDLAERNEKEARKQGRSGFQGRAGALRAGAAGAGADGPSQHRQGPRRRYGRSRLPDGT